MYRGPLSKAPVAVHSVVYDIYTSHIAHKHTTGRGTSEKLALVRAFWVI